MKVKTVIFVIFTARRYASAELAVSLCLSVRVCHESVFYRNIWINRAGFVPNSGLRKFHHGKSTTFVDVRDC